MNSENGSKAIDQWSLRPGLLAVLAIAALALICQLPGTLSFIMVPIALLGSAIGLIVILAITSVLLSKKQPRRGVSVLLVLLLPVLLWRPIVLGASLAHLGLTIFLGIGQIGTYSKGDDTKFATYDWSTGLAGQNTILIHDVTDEIAVPVAQHTHPLSYEDGFGQECAGRVYHLVSHYYVCSF